jgi:hypothetical protein
VNVYDFKREWKMLLSKNEEKVDEIEWNSTAGI